MAIRTINLTVPGGDTPRSANTKINANFADQDNAASRLLGSVPGKVALTEQIRTVTNTLLDNTANSITITDCNDLPAGTKYHVPAGTPNLPSSKYGTSVWVVETFKNISVTVQIATSYSPWLAAQVMRCATDTTNWGDWTPMSTSPATYSETTPDVANVVVDSTGNLMRSRATSYTDTNTTKDSNGFLKAASPIVKVFADKVELNGEAVDQDVTYKKNGVGDYTITTVSGLSTDGWYIELPKDMNGNPKVAVTLLEVDGVISLKSYKRIFSMETFTFEPDLDNPLDIPDTRWIDLRLNEIPSEPPVAPTQDTSADVPTQPNNL